MPLTLERGEGEEEGRVETSNKLERSSTHNLIKLYMCGCAEEVAASKNISKIMKQVIMFVDS